MSKVNTQTKDAPLFYYYNFCFVVQAAGVTKFISQPIQIDQKDLTMPILQGVRNSMGVPAEAVLVSATYLGLMPLAEFSPPVREGMQASPEYLEGIKAGMHNSVEPNPYPAGTVKNLDWDNGYLKGNEMFNLPAKEPEVDSGPDLE